MVNAVQGVVMQQGEQTQLLGVTIDSRKTRAGDLFFAIQGAQFDGHDFCREAVDRGAFAVVVSRSVEIPQKVSVINVKDTLTALGDLASWWRRRFSLSLVAITGSNGKTTTKEMVAALFEHTERVLKNEGNVNNLVGVPLTLLQLEEHHTAAVVEMAMNRSGELKRLAEIAAPTIGVITNIAPAHLEGLGDIEHVAQAKGELFEALSSDATAIVNSDDPFAQKLIKRTKANIIRYGSSPECDIQLLNIEEKEREGIEVTLRIDQKKIHFHLPLLGKHNAWNAAAAMAVAYVMKMDLSEAAAILETMKSFRMRLQPLHLKNGSLLLNDTYNANPSSTKAALEVLKNCSHHTTSIAVLGDMLELGKQSASLHEEIGNEVARLRIDHLFLVGDFASSVAKGAQKHGMTSEQINVFTTRDELIRALREQMSGQDCILVKGSRGMKMEEIVAALQQQEGKP